MNFKSFVKSLFSFGWASDNLRNKFHKLNIFALAKNAREAAVVTKASSNFLHHYVMRDTWDNNIISGGAEVQLFRDENTSSMKVGQGIVEESTAGRPSG